MLIDSRGESVWESQMTTNIDSRFKSIRKNNFDMTSRQVMESFVRVVEDLIAEYQKWLEDAKTTVRDFKSRHNIKNVDTNDVSLPVEISD